MFFDHLDLYYTNFSRRILTSFSFKGIRRNSLVKSKGDRTRTWGARCTSMCQQALRPYICSMRFSISFLERLQFQKSGNIWLRQAITFFFQKIFFPFSRSTLFLFYRKTSLLHSVPSYKKHLYKKRIVEFSKNKKRQLVNI